MGVEEAPHNNEMQAADRLARETRLQLVLSVRPLRTP